MQPWCVGISTLLLSALLPWPGAGQFSVVGPGAAVIASVGEEAVLPCHLSPETDAEDMEVTWGRMDPPALVHHYAASQDQQWQQSPQYRGRTEFLKENINTGQVALRIHPILPSDGGEYRCNFASSIFESEAQVEVLVTASGTAPQIHIEPGGTGEVKLTCTSRGWYPEPEVQWTDLQGLRYLEPASETKTVAKDGLFQVQTSVTADTRTRAVSCAIINPVLSEEKYAQVSMADAMFSRVWPWIVGFAVPLCLLAVATVFGALFVGTRRKLGSLRREYAQSKALGAEGLSVIQRFAANIILDQDTAHPYLKLSEDRKHVRPVLEKQDVPDNPERFDILSAVLGENSFSAGDHYWEVDVASNTRWETGLCVESVKQKSYIQVCPENGFWVLSLRYSELKACTIPPSILKISKDIQLVGIFLQYEKGLISFYNVTECSLLYTFKSTFTKPLKPYFYTDYYIWGRNRGLYLPSCQ